jgi:glycerophosphoryl diester phosphodiesterase
MLLCPKQRSHMFDLIAHRGASKIAPENTLSAIRKAIELSVDFIEIDVHLSKDGVPVVIHDAQPERTTNSKLGKLITEMTLAEIKTLDAGSWFGSSFKSEKIPTLQEVLDLKSPSIGLMIEIKKGRSHPKALVHAVYDLINRYTYQKDIIVGSFSPNIIDEIQTNYPNLSLIGIAEDFNMISHFRAKKLPRLALWYKLLTPDLMQKLHEENTNVWAFTVDEIKTAQFLLSIHVDGLITNDSSLMQEIKRM